MDLHWYLRALEEVVIRVLSETFSIDASRVDDLTGVWVGKDGKELASVENGHLLNLNRNIKMQNAEQQRHILRMLERSLARELELEKKLTESTGTEELKLRLQ
ncbi:Uncharacterized protein Adt_05965 [Abeliophyllum distichum]|uniref:BPL/LPL catalytic domain-containing protein n=1 Tax=Abeliophyllum distichum TaxID=126358 RepID=A0ABD1V5K6_9LAMI